MQFHLGIASRIQRESFLVVQGLLLGRGGPPLTTGQLALHRLSVTI
jgi:hypothetical protein